MYSNKEATTKALKYSTTGFRRSSPKCSPKQSTREAVVRHLGMVIEGLRIQSEENKTGKENKIGKQIPTALLSLHGRQITSKYPSLLHETH